ncbi:related to esterase D [Cephalotrichum gorgonifer]|uniref:feruloyl esterase n=1 Tax=Cephalotrichum gorgonifer TaxID=2041049 RepID=A0AAE8SUH3_9PEZI|nr:related to esterase D [Cephalotrichum gorgonifer]
MWSQLNFLLPMALVANLLSEGVFAAPSAGCGKTPTLGNGSHTLTVNGKQRQYIVKLPDQYDNTKAYPFIFTFHALGGTAQQIADGGSGTQAYYGLPPLANNSAIFVSPNGLNNGWGNQGGEDIAFIDAMMEALDADLCVEQDLRFSTGFSYGGAISYSLACSRPDKIRAVAVLSSGVLSGCNGGTQPVAYYAQHGTSDSVLPIAGGRGMRDRFVKNNGCTPAASEPAVAANGASTKTKYEGCTEGYPVTWVVFNGDHNPGQADPGSQTPFGPGNTWEFFSQFL